MNLNEITECRFCGEKCHSINGDSDDPLRIEFDCGSTVAKSPDGISWIQYGKEIGPSDCGFWTCKCIGKSEPKKNSKNPLIASAPCRRCGSPIKGSLKDSNGTVLAVDYHCGSKLRIASNQMWEFDALCRHTENQPRPKPIVHIVCEGAMNDQIKPLEDAGYVVVLTQSPGVVRILTPEAALASAEEIGMAALEAMQGPTNDSVRAKFAEILFRKLQARDGGAK